MNVVVLGASNKVERYSNMALRALMDHGHEVIPVNPRLREVEGLNVVTSLRHVKRPVHTVSVYLSPQNAKPLKQEMIDLGAQRWIFNPGSECDELEQSLKEAGAEVQRACTLVMLSLGSF